MVGFVRQDIVQTVRFDPYIVKEKQIFPERQPLQFIHQGSATQIGATLTIPYCAIFFANIHFF